jgi:hypothetical protein
VAYATPVLLLSFWSGNLKITLYRSFYFGQV